MIPTSRTAPTASRSPPARWASLAAAGIIALAALAAFGNSFKGAFIFDDYESIVTNPTIRHLWPLGPVLNPPGGGATVTGRPFLNFSLAVNYALSGDRPWSYHALNLTIHILAGLALFGIIRRTLERWSALSPRRLAGRGTEQQVGNPPSPGFGARPNTLHPTLLALAIALIWVLHPLQTESVTYVAQRAESLMGLFYLLTLYCFIRHAEAAGSAKAWRLPLQAGSGTACPPKPGEGGRQRFVAGWAVLSILACLFGMATKEVMVTAPVIVLLYDRTFVTGNFRETWRRRKGLYLGLAGTWLLLGFEVFAAAGRGGTAGFGLRVPWPSYLLTQFSAVVHYLRLTIWPHPLIFDYGAKSAGSLGAAVVPAAVVLLLIVGTGLALFRSPSKPGIFGGRALGFAGAWFFLILAPSSSVIPVATQSMAEHRMYLPLAAVVAVAAIGLCAWAGRRGLIALFAAAAVLGAASAQRNEAYRSDLAIWGDTVAKLPANERAQYALADALRHAGRPAEAVGHYREAVGLDPGYLQAYNNLGIALVEVGRLPEAIAVDEEALRLDPDFFDARYNLGKTFFQAGLTAESIDCFRQALRLRPDRAEVHDDLGMALHRLRRTPEAIVQYEEALRLRPEFPEADYNLGNALAQLGRMDEAIVHYERALRLRPDFAEARSHLELVRRLSGSNAP